MPAGSSPMGWRLATLLALLPAVALAQDWSGASLRAAPALELPPGYGLAVIGVGFHLPQDLAFDPPDGLWILTQADRAGGAGALARLPVGGAAAPYPIDAATLPAISVPFASTATPFRVGSVARHPTSGDLYVAERLGQHVVRVAPAGRVTLYARGLGLLADSKSLAFDAEGRLVVLDFAGRRAVADAEAAGLRELLGEADRYVGPVLYRLRVDEALPLPRNLEYATPLFPAPGLRRRGAELPRYVGVLPLASGELVLSGAAGEIDRLRPGDGTIHRIARAPAARVVAEAGDGALYAVDFLGGRILRVEPDGVVRPFVEGLTRPAAVLVRPDGTVFVAEDTSRVLRLAPAAAR